MEFQKTTGEHEMKQYEIKKPTTWKYDAKKKTIFDYTYDLIDDTRIYLKRSKHIQNIQNFFKKFKITRVKETPKFIKLHSPNIFEEIKISEIQEIKFEKEIQIQNKKSKQKRVITQETEPSVQQVVDALSYKEKVDITKILIDNIVNVIMTISVLIIAILEVIKFLGLRLFHYIKIVAGLPYREALRVTSKIIMVGGSIALMIIAIYFAKTMYYNQKSLLEGRAEDKKYVDDGYIQLNGRMDGFENRLNFVESNATVNFHRIDTRTYSDSRGNIIKKERIR